MSVMQKFIAAIPCRNYSRATPFLLRHSAAEAGLLFGAIAAAAANGPLLAA